MNIILCYPPHRSYEGFGQDNRWLPLGIASLGAYIQREHPNVKINLLYLFDDDFKTAVQKIKRYIQDDDINILGFSCFTEQRFSSLLLAKHFKNYSFENNINIKIILGGAHAFLMSKQLADNYSFIDYIVRGEGEKAFDKIINGTATRIIEPENIKDLNTLPFAIDGFNLFREINIEDFIDEAPIISGRGCTDYCSFCSTTKFWKGYRARKAENIFEEMLKYYTFYGTTKFKFHDDSSTADINNWKELCKLICPYKWKFELTARADQFDDELIYLLKVSGCKNVNLGIESGNAELRNKMNKRLNIEKAKENIKKLMKAGIQVTLLFIVGYAGETEETINDTIKFIKEVNPTKYNVQPLMILAGTKIYEQCKKENWINDNYWLLDKPQPYFTKEHSMDKLNEWQAKLLNCNKKINVLIASPVRQKEEIFKLFMEGLNNLEIPDNVNIHRLFIFNNCGELKKHIKSKDISQEINTNNTYKIDEKTHYWKNENLSYITSIKNSVFEGFINGSIQNIDYIFWVDSDLILHPKTLLSLLAEEKDIISEIFWTKWQPDSPSLPNAWDLDHYSFFPETIEMYKKQGVYKCGGTGACILINKKVIEAGVNYNPIQNISFWGEDRAFSIRAVVAGFEIFIDTKYPAFHIYRDSDLNKAKILI